MGIGFLTVAAVQRWDVPDAQGRVYTFVLLAGQTTRIWHSACWPIARGTRSRSSWAPAAAFLGYLMAWGARAPWWYYGAFFLLGVACTAVLVSGTLVVMEFGQAPEKRPTYIGIASSGVGLTGAVAPLNRGRTSAPGLRSALLRRGGRQPDGRGAVQVVGERTRDGSTPS